MRDKIIELRSNGLSYNQIVAELGCSKSTVAYNLSEPQRERQKRRNKSNKKSLCGCGKFKMITSDLCNDCAIKRKKEDKLDKRLGEYTGYKDIRAHARAIMKDSGEPFCCSICEFDSVVEVCHIKAISDFEKDSPLREVNALSNLIYLCPNHHAMFDKGLLELD